jgi:uncharacterized protein (DUF885 family)
MIRKGFLSAVAMAGALLSAAAPAAPGDASWDAHVAKFIEDSFAANPTFAVYAGRHEFDGRLPDFSAAALGKEAARLEAARARTLAVDPGTLDADRRAERDYLLSVIEKSLFWQVEAQWPQRNPAFYFDMIDPEIYLSKPYAPLAQRMRAFID